MPSSIEADLREVSAACARTLAGDPELELNLEGFSGQDLRAAADASACERRFGLGPEGLRHRPEGASARLFDQLVQARAQALGARWLPGIASNFENRTDSANTPNALKGWAFALYRGRATPACPGRIRTALGSLATVLDIPDEYGRQARALSLALVQGSEANHQGDEKDSETARPLEARAEAEAAGDNAEAAQDDSAEPTQSDVEAAPGSIPPPLPSDLLASYAIYTTRHDRVMHAHDLATPAELEQLRARLDGALLPYRHLVSRLAHQLQRLLLARQRRNWALDQEDGLLDASRLARLVADPSYELVFRLEEESVFQQTAVTLLLDNSGSMRGHSITAAALTADILTRSLERCGIKVEVLGYTTAEWEGGLPAAEWKRAGSLPQPGRLNALRHIIYKSMDTPWRRSRRAMGLMLKDELLKENIDGEALGWACQRLMTRPEPRRLLVVVSDGAPMDKSTAAVNPRGFLDQHLHQVVAWIGARTDIHLYAIGIGHQVARYYPNSVSLGGVDELGSVLMKRLATWLA